jgi:hypothetical protein
MPKGVEFEQQCSYDAGCLQGVTWQWDEIVRTTVATFSLQSFTAPLTRNGLGRKIRGKCFEA